MPPAGDADAAPVTGGRSIDDLWTAADLAAREGRMADAASFAIALLDALRTAAQSARSPGAALLERAGLQSMKLATQLKRGDLFDSVVELYAETVQVMPAAIVNEAHAAVRGVPKVNIPRLRLYVASLRARTGDLSPADRFLVNRIEGLLAVVAA